MVYDVWPVPPSAALIGTERVAVSASTTLTPLQ